MPETLQPDELKQQSIMFFNKASAFFQNDQFDEARKLFQIASEGFKNVAYHEGEITSIHMLGRIEHELGNLQGALKFYEEAMEKSKETNYVDGIVRVIYEKARIDAKNGEFLKAENGFRYALKFYVSRRDENNVQVALNQLGYIAEDALSTPDLFLPSISRSGVSIGSPEEYLAVRALAILSEVRDDGSYYGKGLIQKGLVAFRDNKELFRYALREAARTAFFKNDRFIYRVSQILLNHKFEPSYDSQPAKTASIAIHPESTLFKTPETAAPDIGELLAVLKEEDKEGSYVYRGQTKEYSGPLLPSTFRGILCEKDMCLTRLSPLYEYSLRKCGQKFYGEYNVNFLNHLTNVLGVVPENEASAVNAVYQSVLKNPIAILEQQKSWLEKSQLLHWDDALRLTLPPDEMEIYLRFASKWKELIDNYHRRVIRTMGFFKPFGYLLGTTLAQQYGLSSAGLDATKSLDVAGFFATHSSRSGYTALEGKGNIGIIYRFPYAQSDIRRRNVSYYNYYTLPSIIDLEDVLYRFEKKGLEIEDAVNCFDCYYSAVHLDNLKDVDLFFLPEGALSSSRVMRQKAVIILPDELRKDRQNAEPDSVGIKFPEFQFIEDISQRQGVERFYFRQTEEVPEYLKVNPEYFWPRNDPLLEIIVSIITAVYPMMKFRGGMAHRLDLIDGGFNKEEFLKVCEKIAVKHKIVVYNYLQLLGASYGNLIL